MLSGGIDSATCLYLSKRKGYGTSALTIKFHRIAEGEVRAATSIAKAAGVDAHRFVEIPQLSEVGDMKQAFRRADLPASYIPMRNSIFYSLAASFAEEIRADYIIGGHNKEDQKVFEDAGPEFFGHLQKTIWAASRVLRERRTTILRPLQHKTKMEVISYASGLGLPFELTWSCHGDGTQPCWRCDGCRKRTQAFVQAEVDDPLRWKTMEKP